MAANDFHETWYSNCKYVGLLLLFYLKKQKKSFKGTFGKEERAFH